VLYCDDRFSGPQAQRPYYPDWVHRASYRNPTFNFTGNRNDPNTWASSIPTAQINSHSAGDTKGWWLPAFFGKRDASNLTVRGSAEVLSGAWGWPRADYRLSADADEIGLGSATLLDGGNLACWFYTEDRSFSSNFSMSLDNSNLVIASLKFAFQKTAQKESTSLSFLKHHINGYDHPRLGGKGLVRNTLSYGDLLRQFSLTPYYLDDTGALKEMKDLEHGVTLGSPGAAAAGGEEVPRAFDVRYRLRNPSNYAQFEFGLRIYCRINPKT
jgi:hypothetical protein